MRMRTKMWLVTAATLVMIGCILFAGVMITLKWDFKALATVKYETNIHEISEAFDSISIKSDTADIVFARSDDGTCRVECFEEENANYSVTVENRTLTVELIEKKTVHGFIGLNFDTPKITVYIPKSEHTNLLIHGDTGDIEIPNDFTFKDVAVSLSTGDADFCASVFEKTKIKTSTGDIYVGNSSVGSLDLAVSTGTVTVSSVTCEGDMKVSVSTGKTYLADIRCKNMISRGSTGDISLDNVLAAETFFVERSTGDVKFDRCDAAEIFVETDTGDVRGSLLDHKMFVVQSDTGSVDVPKTAAGGKCEIKTSTGDINISIKQ